MLDGLTKWLNVRRVTETLKAPGDKNAWNVMIASPKKHSTSLIDLDHVKLKGKTCSTNKEDDPYEDTKISSCPIL